MPRLATVLNGASGFLYYVSIAGVTGTKTFTQEDVKRAFNASDELPIFLRGRLGIRTPDSGASDRSFADGAASDPRRFRALPRI